ncbi:MAG: MerR family transcriptional regulator [Deltaproteobacteria bacterium]|jgi:DNA-binding transcriptional MerR regulator|nr:MerR family transcriptional regulator [Deltaproteobacteria bacterium]
MYNIGRLAAQAGCKTMTVRYYERTGLLKPPKRQENGYRWYSEGDLEDLIFIRHCRQHGFSIEETKELLALRAAPEASCGVVDELLERHVRKLDDLLESVRNLRDQLTDLRGRCPGLGPVAECGIMRGLMDREFCPCGEGDGARFRAAGPGRPGGDGGGHGAGDGHGHGAQGFHGPPDMDDLPPGVAVALSVPEEDCPPPAAGRPKAGPRRRAAGNPDQKG